jgi:hypothetical protein
MPTTVQGPECGPIRTRRGCSPECRCRRKRVAKARGPCCRWAECFIYLLSDQHCSAVVAVLRWQRTHPGRGSGLMRPPGQPRWSPHLRRWPYPPGIRHVGSHPAWRRPIPLTAFLQNSHRNGGDVFLIFVANPRTVRSCSSEARTEGTSQPLPTTPGVQSVELRGSSEVMRYCAAPIPGCCAVVKAWVLQQV